MKGEILLIIDSKVSDNASFSSQSAMYQLLEQFTLTKTIMEKEHPYSNIVVEVRMANEANLSA